MREYSVPATVRVRDDENIVDAVYENAEAHGGEVAYRRRVTGAAAGDGPGGAAGDGPGGVAGDGPGGVAGDGPGGVAGSGGGGDDAGGAWVEVTAAEFADEVTATARGLIASGVAVGDRVAVLSRTRYEWTLLDYAILAVGGVTVPIYETSSAEQIRWILSDSDAVAVIVESAGHRALVDGVRAEHTRCWQLDGSDGEPGGVEQLRRLGHDVPADEVHARRRAVRADDLATLIYTSGTTGRPKGCELTHRNLVYEARAVATVFSSVLRPGSSVLLFLPLAHVFGRAIQCAATASRTVIGHTADVSDLMGDLAAFRPVFLLAVPRVFEKVFNGARLKAHAGGKGKIFDAATDTAIAWSTAQDTGGAGLRLRARHALFDRLVYRKLRAAVGGAVVAAASGSAPLGERLGHFFRGVGLPVLEGYGLTETTAAVVANQLGAQRIGSVGRPVPGHGVRIADDGEILLTGPVVFRGYWRNDSATAEALTDGWFHTGDIGALDDAGFLTITGRKKELIITAGGKNVAPAVLEDRLRAHPLVSQCMVVGDGAPFIAALVTIDVDALPAWSAHNGRPADTSVADLVDDDALRAEIAVAVADANTVVSRAEQIREFRILPVDFTESAGEMTPTMKVKRTVVAEHFAADIAAIYATTRQPA